MLAALGWWLNGPGLRWLAPQVAAHFAGKAGVAVAFEVRGTLLGGLEIHGVDVEMADLAVKRITIRELVPTYRVPGVFRGEIESVRATGVHVELELQPGDDDEESEPMDLAALGDTLRAVRTQVVALGFDLSELTVALDGADTPRIELGPTGLRHGSGESGIELDLGAISRGGEVLVEPQAIRIDWTDERLSLDRVVLHPALGVAEFSLGHPADGALFAQAMVDFADARFFLTGSPEPATLSLQLREGVVDAAKVGEVFDFELPATGTLTSFALDVEGFSPDPMAANATLGLLIENARWEEVAVDELNLDATLEAETARLVVRAATNAAEARLDTTSTVDRESMTLRETGGVLEIPRLKAVAERYLAQWIDAEPMPAAALNAEFQVGWGEAFKPASANLDLQVVPDEPDAATGFQIAAAWLDGEPLEAELTADGLTVAATADLDAMRYAGEAAFDEFGTARLVPWLAVARVELPGQAGVDARWNGSGPLQADGDHKGTLKLGSAVWKQSDLPDVSAGVEIDYAWPGRVALRDFTLVRDGQKIEGNLTLDDGMLEIDPLRWTDADGTEMAEVRGSLPVPDDVGAWRRFLAEDTRPLDLTIRSQTLGFDKIATWVPALTAVDPRATAAVEVVLSGNFASPVLDASLDVRGLRATDQPAIPTADIEIKIQGRDGTLGVDGTITTPDYDPVVLSAKLPFAPAAWADDIETLMNAEFEASARLPRLDLSKFASLVPAAKGIAGVITGDVSATGTLGKPVLAGGLELTGGALRFANDMQPDITGVTASVDFALDRATLNSLRATIAGGTLEASGVFTIEPRELDFRLRGNSLPLVRNEDLIMRANADLRVAGPLDTASVSGSVELVDSLFFRDIEILPIGTPFTAPQAAELPKIDVASPTAAIPDPFANWTLDVNFTTAEPMLIRGNLATGRVRADLRIGGTLADPRPNGTVRLLRGRAVLPFSTLEVPEATFTFTPANGLDPVIEARGTAEPRPYRVNLFAYGRLSDPQIVLSSIPPLPQNEIMTLLATGTTTRGLEDPQMASARAIQLFAEEVRRGRVPLGNQLRPLLGLLDRVDFTLAASDPYSSDTFSTATLKLHDRWYLSAGMGEEGNTRIFAIWRLRFR